MCVCNFFYAIDFFMQHKIPFEIFQINSMAGLSNRGPSGLFRPRGTLLLQSGRTAVLPVAHMDMHFMNMKMHAPVQNYIYANFSTLCSELDGESGLDVGYRAGKVM